MNDALHSQMEGKNYYNEHSRPQGDAGALGITLLQRAAAALPLDAGTIGIADLGCAQGHNSLAPLNALIRELRVRTADTPIAVTHTDLASNDFTSLFELLQDSPESYLRGARDVYAYAAGGSFYGRLFPANALHVAWNSIAVHWMSAVPCAFGGDIWSCLAAPPVRDACKARAAADWRAFLAARAAEIRSGGQIVIVASCVDDDGFTGAEGLMRLTNAVLHEMAQDGAIPADRYAAMAIPTYYRSRQEFCAPFDTASAFELAECEPATFADAFYPAYQASGDATAFAQSYTGFFRAFSEPCLFTGAPSGLADDYYARVQKAIAADPAAVVSTWALLLMRLIRR